MASGVIDAFREDLMRMARREISADLVAKVSASDLVQETLLAASRDLEQFRGGGPTELLGWLRGILRHLIQNSRRQYRSTGKRRVDREVGDGARSSPGVMAAFDGGVTPPSVCAMREERCRALQVAIETLPEHYRLVIRWHHQDQLTFEAIAARLGISAEAARKVWGRALLRLREVLGPGHDPR